MGLWWVVTVGDGHPTGELCSGPRYSCSTTTGEKKRRDTDFDVDASRTPDYGADDESNQHTWGS